MKTRLSNLNSQTKILSIISPVEQREMIRCDLTPGFFYFYVPAANRTHPQCISSSFPDSNHVCRLAQEKYVGWSSSVFHLVVETFDKKQNKNDHGKKMVETRIRCRWKQCSQLVTTSVQASH